MQIITPPHKKQSRLVKDKDMDKIRELLEPLFQLCHKPIGKFPGGKALCHCQIESDDPLRFFVLADGSAVINPEIVMKERPTISQEGCLSWPFRDVKKVRRFYKISVNFKHLRIPLTKKEKLMQKFKKGNLILKEYKGKIIEGDLAFIFQHEIDHFNGNTIYG